MAYIGRDPQYGAFEKQALTADGSTTTFTLDYTVGSASSILVSVAGVHQEPETAYNLGSNGTQIVFTAAPASGDTVFVIFLGAALEVATVGSSVITSRAELTTGVQGADQVVVYDNSAGGLKKLSLANIIVGATEDTSPATDDFILTYDTSTSEIKKVTKQNFSPVITLTYNTRTATGDGSTVGFTVTSGMTNDSVIVTENGIIQVATGDYSISGTTLTFTTAPASGVAIKILELPVQSS